MRAGRVCPIYSKMGENYLVASCGLVSRVPRDRYDLSEASLFLSDDWSFQCENQHLRRKSSIWKNTSKLDESKDLEMISR